MAYKVYYQGRRIDGRYAPVNHFFRKVWFWCKAFVTATVVGSALVGIGFVLAASNKVEAVNNTMVINKMPEKIADLKSEVVNAISGCEVPNYHTGQAPIILDTNNRMSIGPMMFQVATVVHYEKVLYNRDVTPLEATTIALDETQAKALAQKIMFEDSKGVANWWNCMNKTGVAAKIDVIKSLEK